MSRGYPDFFGQSVFTKYGQFYHDYDDNMGIVDGENYEFIEILGKGMIYSQMLYFTNVSNPALAYLGFEIDGLTAMEYYFNDFIVKGLTGLSDFQINAMRYDTSGQVFSFALKGGFTFDFQFRSYVKNETGFNIKGRSVLNYSSVE